MKNLLITSCFLLITFVGVSQIETGGNRSLTTRESSVDAENEEKGPKPGPIEMYQIISVNNDTTFVDTTLSIHKLYRFNYLRKDNFELLPFPNVGQTYTRLAYDFTENNELLPLMGARARHFNFMEVEDILYYRVPTPFTELFFKTVYEQGQVLDSRIAINPSEYLNFSIAYKGLRSLGKYQHMLTSNGNFRTTVSYNSPNHRYHLKTHFVSQDLMNEENGGLTDISIENFLSENPEFDDRSRLEVVFEDAHSTLFGKRYFLSHTYDLFENMGFSVGHELDYSYKKFEYRQASAAEIFGPSFEEVGVHDETRLETIKNELSLGFSETYLGSLRVKASHKHYDYGYNTILVRETGFVENKLTGDVLAAGGSYSKNLGGLKVSVDGMMNLVGDLQGYNFEGGMSYRLSENAFASAGVHLNDRAPNWNTLLYQSDYVNYNWQNDFSNVHTQSLQFNLNASEWVDVRAEYAKVDNYTFFSTNDGGFVQPFQHDAPVSYAKVKLERDFNFGLFGLANTFLFQKVLEGDDVLNVPSFITRNSFYYQDYWFKKALYLQTGFTVKYFKGYEMNAYDPVLAEFVVQNNAEFQDLRSVDFFFNGKIRTARIFFELERLDALLLGNTTLAAPGYPTRDFGVRFGLVWNFFM